jgi:hypothetical protein
MRAIVTLWAALLWTTPGRAQQIDQALRLSLESNVLTHDKSAMSTDPDGTTGSRTLFGLGAAGLGVGVGYAVSENVVLGGRVLAVVGENKVANTHAEESSLRVLPYAEYAFDLGLGRPFLALNAGYSGGSAGSAALETSTSTWLIGPSAGAHVFAGPSFSLDIGLQALLQKGTSKAQDVSVSTSGYSVGLTVGISGWLVTASRPEEAPARVETPAPEAATMNENGALEASIALDLPNRIGGVRVAFTGDPNLDAKRISVTVTGQRAGDDSTPCEAPTLDVDGAIVALENVRSSRGGFGKSMVAQRGSLPIEELRKLVTSVDDSWLVLCSQRVLILPAAKRRVARFVSGFNARTPRP